MQDYLTLEELAANFGVSDIAVAVEEWLEDAFFDVEMHWSEDEQLHLRISDSDGGETIIPVDELIEEVIDTGRVDGDFRTLYCVAHELGRYQEQVREAAQLMEEGMEHLADLYGLDVEDLE